MICNPCSGTGIKNIESVPSDVVDLGYDTILEWLKANPESDACICDCCGDGEGAYDEPGHHKESTFGPRGPYGYNGGLPECS